MANFSVVDQISYWAFKILPLVYDESLSYMEVQAKVVAAVNQLIENNNLIPTYIKEQFTAFVESDEMKAIVSNMVTSLILSVKFPPNDITPARGNGVADDTAAIQGCIDYAHASGGGCVYIPSGTYYTSALTLYDNVTIYGESADNTRLVLKAGAKHALITATCDNVQIRNIALDGNILNQINRVNIIDFDGSNLRISDAEITGGKICLNAKSDANGIISVNNVMFGYAIEAHINLHDGDGLDESYIRAGVFVTNCSFKELSETQPAALKHCIINTYRDAVFSNMIMLAVAPQYGMINNAKGCKITGIAPNSGSPVSGSGYIVSFDKGVTALETPEALTILANGDGTLTTSGIAWLYGMGGVKITTSNNNDIELTPNGTGKIKYGLPAAFSTYFKSVKFKDSTGAEYDVLVANESTNLVGAGGEGGGTGVTLPSGGTVGQVLAVSESGLVWLTLPVSLPSGGTAGQFLMQDETGYIWADIPVEIPTGGTEGQVLVLTASGLAWADIPTPPAELPSGGTENQFLKVGASGLEWATIREVPAAGTTGQGVTKTEGGYGWGDFAGLSNGKVPAAQITARQKTISANYVLTANDNGYRILINAATDITITFNADTLPEGAEVEFVQINTGKATFGAGSGVGLHSSNGAYITLQQYARVGACLIGTNNVLIGGDLA